MEYIVDQCWRWSDFSELFESVRDSLAFDSQADSVQEFADFLCMFSGC